ncbi:hypothetical protein RHE_CH02622 [Rhizobium etli CFN 42]|uniref:Uncharacterized protein n=1 Tax=Rhizobium etli (strain ATCC 51251 / DSM 11541 / JCM 21823 / NBRC 15573 / CFN 42) TaxID=347834 RepID=Q2K6Z2_RHIEC|nr:hypothetical protein RHE_CH02622 [Rhizobium etli CFN 42]
MTGGERIAKTPFGARVVIHATAVETGGAFDLWETFTPQGGYAHDDLLDGVVIVGASAIMRRSSKGRRRCRFEGPGERESRRLYSCARQYTCEIVPLYVRYCVIRAARRLR